MRWNDILSLNNVLNAKYRISPKPITKSQTFSGVAVVIFVVDIRDKCVQKTWTDMTFAAMPSHKWYRCANGFYHHKMVDRSDGWRKKRCAKTLSLSKASKNVCICIYDTYIIYTINLRWDTLNITFHCFSVLLLMIQKLANTYTYTSMLKTLYAMHTIWNVIAG